MATLEIHDDRGGVQRVVIARDHPTLFGSSPECEIFLKGSGILPIHGRFRWKGGRFKVDASPEALAVERNGKRVKSASFRIGDEVRVGPFRIFMINPDSGALDEKTRLQPPPLAGRVFEQPDWLRALEVAPPSVDTAVADAEEGVADDRDPQQGARARRGAKADRPRRTGLPLYRRVARMIVATDQTPGQERILTSPLVGGLLVALAALAFLGWSLRSIIARTAAQKEYMQAVESLDDGEYRNAILRFDEFLKANPDDARAGKARVLRALANVRQFALSGSPSWTNALLAARAMVTQVGREPAYRDESTELAELALKAAEGLADRARAEANPEALAEAEEAVALHAKIAGQAAEPQRSRSRVPAKLAQARSAVRKGAARAGALAAMDDALKAKAAIGVYEARDGLVAEFPELAADRAVAGRLEGANALIRDAVRLDPSRRPAETEPNPEPLGPPTSLVFRSAPGEGPAGGPVVYALAEGFAYGLDGANGAPLWHIPVGLSCPFPPQAIAGNDPAALVFDARRAELLRVNGRTGALVWRQAMEGPIASPPLILGNQVIQATPAGKLLFLDLASGELRVALDLGRPLGPTPVSDEAGQFLYVLADEANLFVVRRDPLSCSAVVYTGHRTGSLACPPARLGRYLIVPENHALGEGRWLVYELGDDGANAVAVQTVDLPGWTWGTPASRGSVIWAIGDRGGPVAFSIGEGKVPLKEIARLAPDSRTSGPAFALARSEREAWIASGHSGRYDLNAERGTLARPWTLGEAGPALAPIQMADRLAILTQQAVDEPGVALWGVHPDDGTVRWRTVLGAAWPSGSAADPRGSGLTTLATDGRPLPIDAARLARGGFVEQPLPRPGVFRLPKGPLRRLEVGASTLIVPAPDAVEVLVREGAGMPRPIALPAPLGATPLVWGDALLVPGDAGRAYLIDPTTGASRAEPLVPPFDRGQPTRWRSPARLDDEAVVLADEAGRVRRLARTGEPSPRLLVTAEADLGAALVADPVATRDAVLLATADGRIRALAARDLSPLGAWPLDTSGGLAPVIVGGWTFVADAAGTVFAFGPDGQRLWTTRLEGAPPGGPPVLRDVVLLLGRDGVLHRRSLADGSPLDRIELDLLPAGGLAAFGDSDAVAVPAAPGTIRLLIATGSEAPRPGPDPAQVR